MPYTPEEFQDGEIIDQTKINSLRIPELIPNVSNADKFFSNDGTNFIWVAGSGGGETYRGLFFKSDPSTVVFQRTSVGGAIIKAGTIIDVGGAVVTFAASAAITMPTLAAGTDYSIWLKNDGILQASTNFQTPPASGTWRQIGGFHYAPGGNATARAGGDTTPQINEYSFWDLKFRPACPDPRGMTLVANSFWFDIYPTCRNAVTLGLSSVFNQTIADGGNSPIIPPMFGGNGTSTYPGLMNWFEAQELASFFGKRCATQSEFMALAYGTTERLSSGFTDPVTTNLTTTFAKFTSKWGVMQSTGAQGCILSERAVLNGSASWASTGGRGQQRNHPAICIMGGQWDSGPITGSRYTTYIGPIASYAAVRCQFACDHLISE